MFKKKKKTEREDTLYFNSSQAGAIWAVGNVWKHFGLLQLGERGAVVM